MIDPPGFWTSVPIGMNRLIGLILLTYLLLPNRVESYSVITHIAIIDTSWNQVIVPIIQRRFPDATQDEILNARKFAYGGCIIQDLGYYPSGNKFFSNLLHYVRSGDFVKTLLRNSQNANDYAFALGALAHYASDNTGHALATNLAVPILYPDLRKKYGNAVTYDDKPSAHLKAEFGFDVVQVARGNYLSDSYHDFIGFAVAQDLLKKTFREVYGLSVDDLFPDFESTILTYRHTVTGIIPDAIKIAWQMHKDDIRKVTTQEKFFFRLPRSEFEKNYGTNYKKPSFISRILAFFIKILPGFGPLKVMKFKTPTPEVEELFIKSFESTLNHYHNLLVQARENNFDFPNRDLDTGNLAEPGEYRLTDETYADWVKELRKTDYSTVDQAIKKNILAFYDHPDKLLEPKPKNRPELQEEIGQLRLIVD
jgi:zinc dependent phospholipase C